jgi:hypothetical protein
MRASSGNDVAARTRLTRRDAIVGGLALAAGALFGTRPDPASAANGTTVTVGGLNIGTVGTIFWRTDTGAIGPVYSQAMLAGPNFGGSHRGLEGEVYAPAGNAAVGVRGSGAAAGQFGVLAENAAAGGTALRVNGVASFSRSGRSTISKGKSSMTVAGLTGITTNSMILVTLQGSAGSGVYLRYATRLDAMSFRVVLSKAATSAVSFAWLVLD